MYDAFKCLETQAEGRELESGAGLGVDWRGDSLDASLDSLDSS